MAAPALDRWVYDLSQGANSQLANISTRGYVDTGDNVMIGGFISGNGSEASRIIVRGLGPSLGIDGALQDPILELHDASGNLIASNDDWQDDRNASQVQASPIAPHDPRKAPFTRCSLRLATQRLCAE